MKFKLSFAFKTFFATVICLVSFFVFSEKILAADIRVSGFNSSRNPAPLIGFVPNYNFDQDPWLFLRNSLLDEENFGAGGVVSCPVSFQPFLGNITSGSLVADGQKKAEVFFAGLSNADLTNEEANELAAFIRAGGIVFISGGGYTSYQNMGIFGHDGSKYNNLFASLGISDSFPANEVIDIWPCGASTEPVGTPVTTGPFGIVGPTWHESYNPINTFGLQSVATGFNELCFIGNSVEPEGISTLSATSGDYYRTILAEGKFEKGYLSVSGSPYVSDKNYFLNLFALACSVGTSQAPAPFLDLPWDYESKGLSFSEAALAIGSYFDHEYPFVDVGSVLGEPEEARDSVTSFRGDFRNKRIFYSGHDGYDWLKKAKVYDGDPVLAAASGTATFYPVSKSNGACGSLACGNVIVIDHDNGYQTRYYHLQDNDPVSQSFSTPGFVNQGEVIGKVGSTGTKSSAPHIHFSVIQDKDGNGNFQDNRPDGLTDPFGWQSKNSDPWPNYSFNFRGVDRKGNKSYYLWTKPIANLSKELTSNGGYFRLERYAINFPQNETVDPATVNMSYGSTVTISDSFESMGSTLYLDVIDASGNPMTIFPEEFTLTVDFNNFDVSKYKADSLSIYSSQDGLAWVKEDTNVDFENHVATATIDHASYFALVGEKTDLIPPASQAYLSGEGGDVGWFRSDVEVTISAQDNEGGSGIYFIGYKLDEGYFQDYAGPVIVSDEGEHTLDFFSVDDDENIEEVKSTVFHIDKTPPEARIKFNLEKFDVEVLGQDENEVSVTFEEDKGGFGSDTLTIRDKAGNELKLEGKFRQKDRADIYSIESLSYNNGEIIEILKNHLSIAFNLEKETQDYEHISQNWYDKGDSLLSIIYDGKKNESKIFIKNKGERVLKETEPGIVLLYIYTNNGNLEFGYE